MRLQQRHRHELNDDQLFSYCAYEREQLRNITLPHPLVGMVLWGNKEIWLGDRLIRFKAGDLFAAPRGVPVTLVNIPDEAVGRYETMVMQVTHLPATLAPLNQRNAVAQSSFDLEMTEDLAQALVHAATAISDQQVKQDLKSLRLAEVLSLLRSQHNAACLFEVSLAAEVAWLIQSAPAQAWTAATVARRLGLGMSTLRRKLAAQGTSLRKILVTQRMQAAQAAVMEGALSLEAAELAGYSSRSHFSRRYREQFGSSPTGR